MVRFLCNPCLQLHPEFPSALFNLGVALGLEGDQVGAIEKFEEALSLLPGDSKIMVHLARVRPLARIGSMCSARLYYRAIPRIADRCGWVELGRRDRSTDTS